MSRKRFDGDPFEALRRADPLDRLEVPTDTSEARARALFQEITEMDTMERKPEVQRPRRLRVAMGAVAVAAVIGAVVGGYALFGGSTTTTTLAAVTTTTEGRIVGGEAVGTGGMAMCIQYSDEMLADQQVAFDGTVTSLDDNQVTFAVHHWYKGGEGDTITLDSNGLSGNPTSIQEGGLPLEVGQRYLASGDDGFVWACGFTLTFGSDLADHWAAVFGG